MPFCKARVGASAQARFVSAGFAYAFTVRVVGSRVRAVVSGQDYEPWGISRRSHRGRMGTTNPDG